MLWGQLGYQSLAHAEFAWKLPEGSSRQTRETKQKKTNKTAAKNGRSNRGQGVHAMTNKEGPAGNIQNHHLVVLGRLPDNTAWTHCKGKKSNLQHFLLLFGGLGER